MALFSGSQKAGAESHPPFESLGTRLGCLARVITDLPTEHTVEICDACISYYGNS